MILDSAKIHKMFHYIETVFGLRFFSTMAHNSEIETTGLLFDYVTYFFGLVSNNYNIGKTVLSAVEFQYVRTRFEISGNLLQNT